MNRDSVLTRVATGAAVGGAIGGAVGEILLFLFLVMLHSKTELAWFLFTEPSIEQLSFCS